MLPKGSAPGPYRRPVDIPPRANGTGRSRQEIPRRLRWQLGRSRGGCLSVVNSKKLNRYMRCYQRRRSKVKRTRKSWKRGAILIRNRLLMAYAGKSPCCFYSISLTRKAPPRRDGAFVPYKELTTSRLQPGRYPDSGFHLPCEARNSDNRKGW
jgi:hypothetical protein